MHFWLPNCVFPVAYVVWLSHFNSVKGTWPHAMFFLIFRKFNSRKRSEQEWQCSTLPLVLLDLKHFANIKTFTACIPSGHNQRIQNCLVPVLTTFGLLTGNAFCEKSLTGICGKYAKTETAKCSKLWMTNPLLAKLPYIVSEYVHVNICQAWNHLLCLLYKQ